MGIYFLRFVDGRQCLYDENGEKIVCGDIYVILNYVKKMGGGTIFIDDTITIRYGVRKIDCRDTFIAYAGRNP